MSNFELRAAELQAEESRLAGVYTQLAVSMMQLWLPILNLRLYCFLKGSNLDDKLSQNYDYLKKQRKNVLYLKRTLREILNAVQQGENNARNIVDNLLFDGERSFYDKNGTYGGDQGSPRYHVAELLNIVRKYYPDMNDGEVEKYLKTLNSEGCGYVAFANTVFTYFEERSEAFEKTFGFSMHKTDGTVNYDALITDFYSATDNHNSFFGIDYINPLEAANIFGGTTDDTIKYRFESYMKDHGIDVEVHNDKAVTPATFKALNQKYDVIVMTQPVKLIKENGEPYISDGGHAMKIIDITPTGKYVVSSWGKKFFLDPQEDFTLHQYSLVEYK